MTKNAYDSVLLLQVLAGPDERDANSQFPVAFFHKGASGSQKLILAYRNANYTSETISLQKGGDRLCQAHGESQFRGQEDRDLPFIARGPCFRVSGLAGRRFVQVMRVDKPGSVLPCIVSQS